MQRVGSFRLNVVGLAENQVQERYGNESDKKITPS